jgi:AraC-like DNA-binding protein
LDDPLTVRMLRCGPGLRVVEPAHHDLSKLRLEESTVTQVALDNGFTHLGRFSVAFHQRFGETPSERLALLPGQKS